MVSNLLTKKRGIRRAEISLAALVIVVGAFILLLTFNLHLIGITRVGFGKIQTQVAVLAAETTLIGIIYLWLVIRNNDFTLMFISGISKSLWQLVQANRNDIKIAFCLLLGATIIGTCYVFFIHSAGVDQFYFATADPYKGTRITSFADAIYPYGVFYGVVIALSYGVFRLGMGWNLAIACALLFMLSSFHLSNLPPSIMRSYSKVPFSMAAIFMLGLLIGSPLRQQRLFSLAALSGLVLGVGLWVREDLILFVFPFLLGILCFLPGGLTKNWKSKIIATLLFIGVFISASLPVLTHSVSRGTLPAVGGLMTPLDERLGVTRPAYDWGYLFLDEFIYAISSAPAIDSLPGDMVKRDTHAEDHSYSVKIAQSFPADMLIRAYASVIKVLELPFAYGEPPIGIANKWVTAFYSLKAALLNPLVEVAVAISAIALLIMSRSSTRGATFCLFLLIYLCGYPAVQFLGKHYFYLEIVSLCALGFVLQRLAHVVRRAGVSRCTSRTTRAAPRRFLGTSMRRSMTRVACFGLASVLILLIPLIALRQYQADHLQHLLSLYADAERHPLPFEQTELGNGNIRIIPSASAFAPAPQREVSINYLLAEFSQEHCDHSIVRPIVRYERVPLSGRPDFSRTLNIRLEAKDRGPTRAIIPIITHNASEYLGAPQYFRGLELSSSQARCLLGFYRLKVPPGLPPLTVTLMPSWKNSVLYQQLADWETSLFSDPYRAQDKREIQPVTENMIAFIADIVRNKNETWIIEGYATPQADSYDFPVEGRKSSQLAQASFAEVNVGQVDTDLLRTRPVELEKGSRFVAQGKMLVGGVTFALVKDGHSVSYANVTVRGRFAIALTAPEDGMYVLGMANNLNGYTSLENNLILTKLGYEPALSTRRSAQP